MALLRDAAIIHTDSDGRQTVHLLNAPLRDWRPSRRQRVYQFESEDGTITTRAVGGVRWDAEVRVRFDALPTSLMEILALGVVDGLLYVPSLSAGVPGYEMQVVGYDDRIALDPDEARWAFGEYEVTFAIRRPAGETLEGRFRGLMAAASLKLDRADAEIAVAVATRVTGGGWVERAVRTYAATAIGGPGPVQSIHGSAEIAVSQVDEISISIKRLTVSSIGSPGGVAAEVDPGSVNWRIQTMEAVSQTATFPARVIVFGAFGE